MHDTGLYYVKARYYSPDLGRWLTKDTDGGDKESPQSINPYLYADNDPVDKVDPDGNIAFAVAAGGVVAGFGITISLPELLIGAAAAGVVIGGYYVGRWVYCRYRAHARSGTTIVYAKGKNKTGTQRARLEKQKRLKKGTNVHPPRRNIRKGRRR